jgi:AcrR family transcriptional regulator
MKAPPLRLVLREATTTALLDAAEQVAARDGISGASLQAIAEQAGVAVGTIYNYFDDKTLLFDALFARRREELFATIDAATKRHCREPFDRQLAAFVRAVFEHFDVRRAFLRIALDAQAERLPVGKGQAGNKQPAMQQLQQRAERVVRIGIREGLLREDASNLLATVLVSVVKGVLAARALDEQPFARDTERVVDIFLHGAAK